MAEVKYRYVAACCKCGCSFLEVRKFDDTDDDDDYYINSYKSEFFTEQVGIFNLLLGRVKHAWFTLIGKDYCLYDVVLDKKRFEEFRNQINKL